MWWYRERVSGLYGEGKSILAMHAKLFFQPKMKMTHANTTHIQPLWFSECW